MILGKSGSGCWLCPVTIIFQEAVILSGYCLSVYVGIFQPLECFTYLPHLFITQIKELTSSPQTINAILLMQKLLKQSGVITVTCGNHVESLDICSLELLQPFVSRLPIANLVRPRRLVKHNEITVAPDIHQGSIVSEGRLLGFQGVAQ